MTSNYAGDQITMQIEPVLTKPTETSSEGYFLRSFENYGFFFFN